MTNADLIEDSEGKSIRSDDQRASWFMLANSAEALVTTTDGSTAAATSTARSTGIATTDSHDYSVEDPQRQSIQQAPAAPTLTVTNQAAQVAATTTSVQEQHHDEFICDGNPHTSHDAQGASASTSSSTDNELTTGQSGLDQHGAAADVAAAVRSSAESVHGQATSSLSLSGNGSVPVEFEKWSRKELAAEILRLRGVIASSGDKQQQELEFHRNLLKSVGQSIICSDLTGTVTYWNRAAIQMYGWEEEEAVGHSVFTVLEAATPVVQSQGEEIMAMLAQGRRWSGEYSIRTKAGRVVDVMVVDTPIMDSCNQLIGIIGVSTDITEMKRKEAEILRLNAELEARVAERTEQLQRSNALLKEEVKEHLRARQHLHAVAQDMEASRAKILEQAGRLERLVVQLRAAQKEAESASRLKTQFLACMSHEIRTPMNAVIGMTNLILSTPLTEDQLHYVQTVQSSGDALLSIIDDILDFSKIEAGELLLEYRSCSFLQCLEEVVDMFAVKAQEKGLEIISLVDPSVPSSAQTDPTRLRQVLTNIISNALKFTQKGHVFIEASATPWSPHSSSAPFLPSSSASPSVLSSSPLPSHLLHVVVQDSGIGISKPQLSRLFRPFSQGDASTTRRFGGTGLGLVISKQLVEMLGGRVRVESEGEGKGATFHFTIALFPPSPSLSRAAPLFPQSNVWKGPSSALLLHTEETAPVEREGEKKEGVREEHVFEEGRLAEQDGHKCCDAEMMMGDAEMRTEEAEMRTEEAFKAPTERKRLRVEENSQQATEGSELKRVKGEDQRGLSMEPNNREEELSTWGGESGKGGRWLAEEEERLQGKGHESSLEGKHDESMKRQPADASQLSASQLSPSSPSVPQPLASSLTKAELPFSSLLAAVVSSNANLRSVVGRQLSAVGFSTKLFGSGRHLLQQMASTGWVQPQIVVMDMELPESEGLATVAAVEDGFRLRHGLSSSGSSRCDNLKEARDGAMPIVLLCPFGTAKQVGERQRGHLSFVTAFLNKPLRQSQLLTAVAAALHHSKGSGCQAPPPTLALAAEKNDAEQNFEQLPCLAHSVVSPSLPQPAAAATIPVTVAATTVTAFPTASATAAAAAGLEAAPSAAAAAAVERDRGGRQSRESGGLTGREVMGRELEGCGGDCDVAVTAGRSEVAVTAGRSEVAVTVGRSEVAVTAERSEVAVTAGRSEVAVTAGGRIGGEGMRAGSTGRGGGHQLMKGGFKEGLAERHPLRILLVEDNLVNQKVATRMLRQMGYEADIAGNGIEALKAAEEKDYDLVFMDIQMPLMDGIEATKRIRASVLPSRQPRIVAMTANVLQSDRQQCLASGMDAFLSKPIRVSDLVSTLEETASGGSAVCPR